MYDSAVEVRGRMTMFHGVKWKRGNWPIGFKI